MIKTHREKITTRDYGMYDCYFCSRIAAYWTQNEQPDGKPQYPVIWTCQNHTEIAHKMAITTVPSKVCKILCFADGMIYPYPLKPVKTRPITGLNVSTKAGVYRVEFYRDNAIREYRIMNWKRIILLDSLLKKYCEVAEVNLFSCGQVSIWYNMKEGK